MSLTAANTGCFRKRYKKHINDQLCKNLPFGQQFTIFIC